jgi:hypothetical protein
MSCCTFTTFPYAAGLETSSHYSSVSGPPALSCGENYILLISSHPKNIVASKAGGIRSVQIKEVRDSYSACSQQRRKVSRYPSISCKRNRRYRLASLTEASRLAPPIDDVTD